MLHLIKLTAGCNSTEELQRWVMNEKNQDGYSYITTWQMPKKAKELIGGSLYRVINGFIQCRYEIIGFEPFTENNRTETRIFIKDEQIKVIPTPRRPFQGWRYLKEEDAPKDMISKKSSNIPQDLLLRLGTLGLL